MFNAFGVLVGKEVCLKCFMTSSHLRRDRTQHLSHVVGVNWPIDGV